MTETNCTCAQASSYFDLLTSYIASQLRLIKTYAQVTNGDNQDMDKKRCFIGAGLPSAITIS